MSHLKNIIYILGMFASLSPAAVMTGKPPNSEPNVNTAEDRKIPYAITLTRFELDNLSPGYMGSESYATVETYDDATSIIKGKLDVIKPFPPDTLIEATISHLTSNNLWEQTEHVDKTNVCEFFNHHEDIFEEVSSKTELPRNCTIGQGSYNISGTGLLEKVTPRNLELGRYHLEASLFNNLDRIISVSCDFQIEEKADLM